MDEPESIGMKQEEFEVKKEIVITSAFSLADVLTESCADTKKSTTKDDTISKGISGIIFVVYVEISVQ